MAKIKRILEVGYNRINKRAITLDEVPTTPKGWIDATKYAMKRFELVTVKTCKKEYPGWWTGHEWYSRTKPRGDKIYWWKPIPNSQSGKVSIIPSL